MKASPALFLVLSCLLPGSLWAAPDLSLYAGANVAQSVSRGARGEGVAGVDAHIFPSVNARLGYAYAAGIGRPVSPGHAMLGMVQGRLDMINVVPWLGLGGRVNLGMDARLGGVLEVGVDILMSPTLSWGGLLGVGSDPEESGAFSPHAGLFCKWTIETSSPF